MKKIYFTIAIIALTAVNGCNVDEFLDRGPLDEYTSTSVFKSEADLVIASNHLYTFLPHLDQ